SLRCRHRSWLRSDRSRLRLLLVGGRKALLPPRAIAERVEVELDIAGDRVTRRKHLHFDHRCAPRAVKLDEARPAGVVRERVLLVDERAPDLMRAALGDNTPALVVLTSRAAR